MKKASACRRRQHSTTKQGRHKQCHDSHRLILVRQVHKQSSRVLTTLPRTAFAWGRFFGQTAVLPRSPSCICVSSHDERTRVSTLERSHASHLMVQKGRRVCERGARRVVKSKSVVHSSRTMCHRRTRNGPLATKLPCQRICRKGHCVIVVNSE